MGYTEGWLVDFRNRHRERLVLSLYLPIAPGGSPEHAAWRQRADAQLKELSAEVGSSDEGLSEALAAATDEIARTLDAQTTMPQPGTWALFATAEETLFSHVFENLSFALARFGPGPRIAPLIGLPQLTRRGALALVDVDRARIFTIEGNELTESADLIGDRRLEDISDVGVSKRAATASGVRGQSGKDRAERAWSAAAVRFAGRIRTALLEAAGPEGVIILGGAHRMAQAVLVELGTRAGVAHVPSLGVELTDAEVRDGIQEALSDLHAAAGSAALQRVESSVGRSGRGCLGWNDSVRALRDASVQTLLIARSLVHTDPDRAEDVVARTLDQGGTVVEVTGDHGDSLLQRHDGVAAVLRYAQPRTAVS